MSWRQPYAGRLILALIFAVAFLINGGLGLGVGLTATPSHVNGLSAVVCVFGLIALAAAARQIPLLIAPAPARDSEQTPEGAEKF